MLNAVLSPSFHYTNIWWRKWRRASKLLTKSCTSLQIRTLCKASLRCVTALTDCLYPSTLQSTIYSLILSSSYKALTTIFILANVMNYGFILLAISDFCNHLQGFKCQLRVAACVFSFDVLFLSGRQVMLSALPGNGPINGVYSLHAIMLYCWQPGTALHVQLAVYVPGSYLFFRTEIGSSLSHWVDPAL